MVDFIIIGAPKCATTSIYKILSSHPEVGLSKIKETDYFISENKEYKDYHKYFNFSNKKKIYGEVSTKYSFYPMYGTVWDRIYRYNPNTKIIYIIRNQIDRTYSQYIHWLERGYTDLSFLESLKKNPEIINTSKYYMQIKPYIDTFGKDKVVILSFEEFVNKSWDGNKKHYSYDIKKQKFEVFRNFIPKKILSYFGNLFTIRKSKVYNNKPIFSSEDRRYISNVLKEDIDMLNTIIDFSI